MKDLPCHVKACVGCEGSSLLELCRVRCEGSSLLKLWIVTKIFGEEATLFCTDCCSSYCESCSNLSLENPRRQGHSLKPITETDPKTQDPLSGLWNLPTRYVNLYKSGLYTHNVINTNHGSQNNN